MSEDNGQPLDGQVKVLAFLNLLCRKARRVMREIEVLRRKYEVEVFDYRSLEAQYARVSEHPVFLVVSGDVELCRTNNLSELLS